MKKKILFNSNFSKFSTGFGRHSKAILTRLFKTGKYDLVEYASAPIKHNDPVCKSVPWKCYGAIPDSNEEYKNICSGDNLKERLIGYGHYYIDKIIELEKPDVAIFVEDIWGVNGYWHKPWFKKIHSIIWSPVDSLPTHELMADAAKHTKNLWVKADFARKDLHAQGFTHVETWPAIIDQDPFFPLDPDTRTKYRQILGLDEDTFIIGFVFRNQLRKLVGSLIDAFKIFKEEQLKVNPNFKAKLLLHTFWDESEGWNIPQLIRQNKLDNEDIVTTYLCYKCNRITIKSYSGQQENCQSCGTEKSVNNPSVNKGITESELNIVYNMMDFYCHPMTSGGFEMPILEACLAGLPIATCPYSCGETYTNNPDVFAFDLSYYRERSSNFLKCQPSVDSIVKSFEHYYSMGKDGRKEVGNKMRQWATDNFNPDVYVKKLEEFIDNLPNVEYNFNIHSNINVDYPMPNIEDHKEFVIDLYKNILATDINERSEDFINIMDSLYKGNTHESVYSDFIKYGKALLNNKKSHDFSKYFIDNGHKRLLYVMPENFTDCYISLTLLDILHKQYPEYDFYIATKPVNFPIFQHLPYLKRLIPYEMWMDDFTTLEGYGDNKGYVDIAFQPYITTQRLISYYHNGLDEDTLQILNQTLTPKI